MSAMPSHVTTARHLASQAPERFEERAVALVLGSRAALGSSVDRVRNRLSDVHDDDTGAQTLEYAMLGGLASTFIVVLIEWIRRSGVLQRLLEMLLEVLFSWVTGFFG